VFSRCSPQIFFCNNTRNFAFANSSRANLWFYFPQLLSSAILKAVSPPIFMHNFHEVTRYLNRDKARDAPLAMYFIWCHLLPQKKNKIRSAHLDQRQGRANCCKKLHGRSSDGIFFEKRICTLHPPKRMGFAKGRRKKTLILYWRRPLG